METTVAQRIKSILNDNQISIAAFAKNDWYAASNM